MRGFIKVKSILSIPFFYNFLQNIVGAQKARKNFVSRHLPLKPGDRLLDLGCGTAELLEHLPKDIIYHGYDLSEVYIEQAKKKFPNRGSFCCQDVSKLKIPDEDRFDWVVSTGLLHHLSDEEVLRLSSSIKSLLKDSGKFITLDCGYTEGQSKIARFFARQDRGRFVRRDEDYVSLMKKTFSRVEKFIYEKPLRISYTHIILESSNV